MQPADEQKRNFRWLAVAVVWLMVVRFALAYSGRLHWVTHDTRDYFEQAKALLAGDFVPYFPNGFPALIAAVWSWTGVGVLDPLLWLSILFSTGTAVCVFFLAKEWFAETPYQTHGAAFAFLVFAHWPNHLRFVPRILTDIPAAFFVTVGMLAVARGRSLLAGLVFGIAVVFRSNLLLIWLGTVGLLVWQQRPSEGGRALITGLVPIGLLVGYGFAQTGEIGLGGNLQHNLMKSVDGSQPGLGYGPHESSHSVFGAFGRYLEVAIGQPVTFLKQRVHALWQLWGPWPLGGFSSDWHRLFIGLRTPLVMLAGVGFWHRRREWLTWLLAIPFCAITLVHVGFFGLARFTIPAEPTLAVLAVEGGVATIGLWGPDRLDAESR